MTTYFNGLTRCGCMLHQIQLFLYFICLIFNAEAFVGSSLRFKLRSSLPLTLALSYGDRMHIPKEIAPTKFNGPGCVLLAQATDSSHFFVRASVFIFQHSEEKGSRGVILERPTAFTMGESSPGIGVFEGNTLYMGGDDGSDTAVMLGKFELAGACKYVGAGIYIGGVKAATDLVKEGGAVPKDFKFFFNTAEWGPGVLEKEIQSGRWDVVQVPPEDILCQDNGMSLWNKARNKLMSQKR